MARRILISLAFVLVASTVQAQDTKPAPLFSILQGVTVTATMADAVTSTYLFGQGKAREVGIGPTHQPLVFGIVKGSSAMGLMWATNRIRRTHPKLAAVILIAASSMEITLAARNMRLIQQGRR